MALNTRRHSCNADPCGRVPDLRTNTLSGVPAIYSVTKYGYSLTPTGILSAHLADQISHLTGNDRSSQLAVPYLPGPEKTKALAMPGHDRFGADDGQRRAPAAPDAGEPDP